MSKKDREQSLCPLDELLPYTMHMMETMWSYDEEKNDSNQARGRENGKTAQDETEGRV